MADDLAAGTHRVGELMFEVVPAHLSDTPAADLLARCARRRPPPGTPARPAATFGCIAARELAGALQSLSPCWKP